MKLDLPKLKQEITEIEIKFLYQKLIRWQFQKEKAQQQLSNKDMNPLIKERAEADLKAAEAGIEESENDIKLMEQMVTS